MQHGARSAASIDGSRPELWLAAIGTTTGPL